MLSRNGNYEVLAAEGKREKIVFVPTISAQPSKGETINLLAGDILYVATNYEMNITENYYGKGDCFAPEDVVLSWESQEGASYYTVKISTESDMSNAESYVTFDKFITISDLYSGEHYFYQVIATFEGKTVKSRVFDFTTAALPRTIELEGVSNTRDIGGYVTEDGKYRVRQGMVYRGGQLDNLSQDAKNTALYTYGFKTDLDLRGALSKSPLGDDVNFVNVSGPYYTSGSWGIIAPSYRQALITEIKTFANEENYPIYVHCSLGRDRTGTLVFLINSLLGVGKDDLFLDYELSFLSERGCMDGARPEAMVGGEFADLYNFINNYKSKGTFVEKTEQFMLDLGITPQEIKAIRSIMLEEVNE